MQPRPRAPAERNVNIDAAKTRAPAERNVSGRIYSKKYQCPIETVCVNLALLYTCRSAGAGERPPIFL